MKTILSNALRENHLNVGENEQRKLLDFLKLMLTWNRVFNLTTITKPREMVYLHLIDSLMVQSFLQGDRLLDVGTGAGLPGIPLAIINPKKNWVLLDKNSKKTRFLTQLIAELDLKNVDVVHARCEDFKTDYCFDSILSRAFGSLQWFHDATKHLICANGKWIAMKGKYPQDELEYLPYVREVCRLTIKGMDIKRHIVTFKEGVTWEK